MLRKALLVFLVMTGFVLTQATDADASSDRFVIHELNDPEGLVTSVEHRDWGDMDSIRMRVRGTKVKGIYIASHTQSWETLTEKNYDAASQGFEYFEALNFTCNTQYRAEFKDASGNVLVSTKLTVTGLDKPSCNSDGDGFKPHPDDEPTPEPEPDIGSGECSSAICKCIAELKAPIQEVKTSVDNSNSQLSQLNQTSTQIKDVVSSELSRLNTTSVEIRDGIYDLTAEFQTDQNYSVPSMPDVSNLLDQNKPIQHETPFTDTNTYFTDQGDAADPGKLPMSPEIKDWEGFTPDLPMPPDQPLQEDLELKMDVEKNLDLEMKTEKEMIPDSFKQDTEMKKEVMEIEPVQKVDTFTKTEEYNHTNKMNQNMFFEQTNQFSGSGGNE